MAGAKEIRTQISSIKSTQKITRAMEMVAASKMRKAQNRMSASRPYAEKMREVIGPKATDATASSSFANKLNSPNGHSGVLAVLSLPTTIL